MSVVMKSKVFIKLNIISIIRKSQDHRNIQVYLLKIELYLDYLLKDVNEL
jgi:hypothetical protein